MAVPFRFIHAADLHLHSPFRGLSQMPEGIQDRLRQSTFGALRSLTDTAIREKVDFMVIAGDLFDEADRSLKAQLALVREWEKLSEHGIQVFVIHGNHDPLSGARASLRLPSNVTIFGSDRMTYEPAYRRDGELAAFVYGMSYGTRHVTDNLAAGYVKAAGAPFHIAMLHGNVNGDAEHDPYAPCSLTELISKGYDYWALGHIHKRAVLHTYPHVVYPGNTQGRHSREQGAKGCYVNEVRETGELVMTFCELHEVLWSDIEVPIGGLHTEHELANRLQEVLLQELDKAGESTVMLRFVLTGTGRLHHELMSAVTVSVLLEQLQELCLEQPEAGWVYHLEAATAPEYSRQLLEEEDSFIGEMLRLAARMEADEGRLRALTDEAVAPLTGHARLGRLLRSKWDKHPQERLRKASELAIHLLAVEANAGKIET
ncbi:exonuclease SbcCD subunit D [Paenibacillus sp. GCM10023252]|uniref:metallophosphoesterase family protein n=1 Tax=Paenibacillus sp. GCM10023252 TaxID=3252649 RepID=UPI00360C1EBF